MIVWNPLPVRRFFFSTPWQIMALLAGLLALSSCALNTPVSEGTKTPAPTSSTSPSQAGSPFKPGPQAARILNDCSIVAAAGGCFSPEQVQTFYNLNPLYAQGFTGKGQTIVIIDSFGSPTIKQDLHTFDQTFGLPDPPKFDVIAPLGQPSFNSGWAVETTLDVEWSHAIAPEANIVLLVSPVDETEGVQGFPEFEQLSIYAMDHHLGQVFTMSFGATEATLVGDACNENLGNGEDLLREYDQKVFQRAVTEHITMLASSGDDGATDATCDTSKTYNFRAVGWPASDPLVTAIGGTEPSLKDKAGHFGSESVWNDDTGAGGGGISQFYTQPDWQKNLPNQGDLNGKRAIPDVSWGAAGNFPVYQSFAGNSSGWIPVAGTSASSPQWAGVIAIANQMAGEPLGFLNPALYQLAGKGFHDITDGDNSARGVSGFPASPGWDLATGWGTPDVAVLAPLLVTAVQQTAG